jgi:hypothetical protein
MRRMTERFAGRVVPAAALLQLGLFGYFVARTMIRTPFMDMLAWMVSYLYFKDHGGFASYLWAFHNEHHLIWMRLLTVVDVELFRGAGFAFIMAGTAAALSLAALVGWFVRREAGGTAVWLAPMLVLTAANAVDCGIPINTVYPIAVLCMVGSIVLLESGTLWLRVLALPVAMAAGFGNGVGLVIWPVLVWLSWRQRGGLLWPMLVLLCGVLFIGVYAYGTPSTTPLAVGLSHAAALFKMMDYALAYIGLPFSRAPRLDLVSRFVGLALLAAGLVALVRVSLSANTRLNRSAVALILITLGSAAMAAIGRVDLEPDVRVPVRYTMMVTPLHVGLLCLVAPRLRVGVSAGFAVVLLAMQLLIGRAAVRVSDAMRVAIHAYYLGDRDPVVTRFVFPDVADADRLIGVIRARGLLGPE